MAAFKLFATFCKVRFGNFLPFSYSDFRLFNKQNDFSPPYVYLRLHIVNGTLSRWNFPRSWHSLIVQRWSVNNLPTSKQWNHSFKYLTLLNNTTHWDLILIFWFGGNRLTRAEPKKQTESFLFHFWLISNEPLMDVFVLMCRILSHFSSYIFYQKIVNR